MAKTLAVMLCCVVIVFCFYLLAKNENTLRKQMLIGDAIHQYQLDMIRKGCVILVDYSDCESYINTVFRLWDWGYTRILPPEKFRIIELYIKK